MWYTDSMAKDIELDDNPDEEVIDVEEVAERAEVEDPSPEAISNRITELKALAYDHLSAIERLQAELRNINEAIKQLNDKLNPVEQGAQR